DRVVQLADTGHVVHHPGVVDEDVDAAVGLDGARDERLRRLAAGDAALQAVDGAALLSDAADRGDEPLGDQGAGDDRRALGGEAGGDGEPDPRGGPGNDGNLVLESHGVLPYMRRVELRDLVSEVSDTGPAVCHFAGESIVFGVTTSMRQLLI